MNIEMHCPVIHGGRRWEPGVYTVDRDIDRATAALFVRNRWAVPAGQPRPTPVVHDIQPHGGGSAELDRLRAGQLKVH